MTIQDRRTVMTETPVDERRLIVSHTTETSTGPSGAELLRRIVILVFGIIQLLILLRIGLLLVDARTGNQIVSTILDMSQVFVAPFEGIARSDALHAGGSVLDVAAVLALIGWTVVEVVVLWAIGLFRREPA